MKNLASDLAFSKKHAAAFRDLIKRHWEGRKIKISKEAAAMDRVILRKWIAIVRGWDAEIKAAGGAL